MPSTRPSCSFPYPFAWRLPTFASFRSAAAAFLVAAALLVPGTAVAQQVGAHVTTNLNQRAGPGTRYPALVVVPKGAAVALFGCVRDLTWCDGAYRGNRGWFSARYLRIPYRNTSLTVASYVRYAYLPTVSFNIDSYWDRYYRERPFFAQLSVYASGGSVNISIGSFYRPLAQHGRWVELRGRYVFVPRVGSNWRPYTEGHWAYTNRYGWMWVSDEPFGWATYHYGRWAYSERFGWIWVPGTRWAPAWVAWRQSNDYLAWAPLPPDPNDRFGISINISVGNIPNYYWRAVHARDFQSPDISNVVIGDNNQIISIVNQTEAAGDVTIVNNVVVNNVVNVDFVEQATGQQVVVHDVALTPSENKNGAVSGDTIEVYHPVASELVPEEAPAKVATEKEVAAESKTTGQAGGEAATADLVPPAPTPEEVPPENAAPPSETPPMAGEEAAPPAGEAAPEEGPAPEGVEPCPEGTVRQEDGDCAAPQGTPPPAEQVTPETPVETPAAPEQPAPAPEQPAPAPEPAAPPPSASEPAPPAGEASPGGVEPCPEGTVRQEDGNCAAPQGTPPPAEQVTPETPVETPAAPEQPAPAPEQPAPAPEPAAPPPSASEPAPPAGEASPGGLEPCPEGTVRQEDGNCAAPQGTPPPAEQVTPETPVETPAAPEKTAPAPEQPAPSPEPAAPPPPASEPASPAPPPAAEPAPAPTTAAPPPQHRNPHRHRPQPSLYRHQRRRLHRRRNAPRARW